MSWWMIAYKNLIQDSLRLFFNLVLMAVAVGLLLLLTLVSVQFKNHLEGNLGEVDLILGAKGSPLQSVLCNMFHVDAPTGNIAIQSIKPFLRKDHPIVKQSLALALGDNVKGYRFVGTTLEYFDWYRLSCAEGSFFTKRNEVVIGFEVAKHLGFKIGTEFKTGHGLVEEAEMDHEHDDFFVVKGILALSNTISDRLVFAPLDAYWHMHEHDEHDPNAKDSNCLLNNESLLISEGPITSLLLRFRGNNIQALNFGRSINENTELMASNPAIELNRMYELTGSATDLFSGVALVVGILALFALFISLWQALNERKKEVAILRIGGASKFQIFWMNFSEALMLSLVGIGLGIILSHGALYLFSESLDLATRYGIHSLVWLKEETRVVLFCFLIGIGVAVIPSVFSYRRDILKTLTEV